MSSEFAAPPENYKPDDHVISPYMRARAEWDLRLGHTTVQAKNWRIAFFLVAISTLILLGLNAYQITQRKLIPVVITVNQETGMPTILGQVGERTYEPKKEEIKYFLSQFIQKVRTVPSDPIIIKKNWIDAYKFLRSAATVTLNAITNDDPTSPLKQIGDETVTVQLLSITQVVESKSYQARWSESIYGKNGSLKDQYKMSGVFTIEVSPPNDEASVLANPLGLYISTFQWAKEL